MGNNLRVWPELLDINSSIRVYKAVVFGFLSAREPHGIWAGLSMASSQGCLSQDFSKCAVCTKCLGDLGPRWGWSVHFCRDARLPVPGLRNNKVQITSRQRFKASHTCWHLYTPWQVKQFTSVSKERVSYNVCPLALIPLYCLLSRVWVFVTPWTVAHQAPLSMGSSRQEYWSGWVAIPFSRGSSRPRDRTQVSCTAGRVLICPSGQTSQGKSLWTRQGTFLLVIDHSYSSSQRNTTTQNGQPKCECGRIL